MSVSAAALLPRFLHVYPFQPATALWRATEIAALSQAGLPRGSGLDLGCGDGLLTSLVLEACDDMSEVEESVSGNETRQWTGIDPDAAEVELARQSGLYQTLLNCGGEALPLPDAHFDFVLSNSVLEHIPAVQPVLGEAARVLKPGGEAIFTVPSTGFHRLLRGPWWGSSWGAARASYLSALDARLAHFYYWDEARWRQELDAVGLDLVSAQPYLNRAQTRRWEWVSRVTAGLLSLLTGQKLRPIEIQRTLGLRTPGRKMPRFLASIVAKILAAGLDLEPQSSGQGSCLLLRAVKSGSATARNA